VPILQKFVVSSNYSYSVHIRVLLSRLIFYDEIFVIISRAKQLTRLLGPLFISCNLEVMRNNLFHETDVHSPSQHWHKFIIGSIFQTSDEFPVMTFFCTSFSPIASICLRSLCWKRNEVRVNSVNQWYVVVYFYHHFLTEKWRDGMKIQDHRKDKYVRRSRTYFIYLFKNQNA
jgi:hypothetical protein